MFSFRACLFTSRRFGGADRFPGWPPRRFRLWMLEPWMRVFWSLSLGDGSFHWVVSLIILVCGDGNDLSPRWDLALRPLPAWCPRSAVAVSFFCRSQDYHQVSSDSMGLTVMAPGPPSEVLYVGIREQRRHRDTMRLPELRTATTPGGLELKQDTSVMLHYRSICRRHNDCKPT